MDFDKQPINCESKIQPILSPPLVPTISSKTSSSLHLKRWKQELRNGIGFYQDFANAVLKVMQIKVLGNFWESFWKSSFPPPPPKKKETVFVLKEKVKKKEERKDLINSIQRDGGWQRK